MAITSQPGVYPSIGEEGGMKVGIVDDFYQPDICAEKHRKSAKLP